MYVEGKYINGTEDLTEIYRIRQLVFQKQEYTSEHLYGIDTSMICDEMAVHAIIKIQEKIVGVATLFYDGEIYLLDQVAVIVEERRKKYGDFLVRMLADRAFQNKADSIMAFVPIELYPFFKSIGFQKEAYQGELLRCVLYRGGLCKECQP